MLIILVWRKHWFFSRCFSHIDWLAFLLAHTDNHKVLMVLQYLAYLKLCTSSLSFPSLYVWLLTCSRRNGLIEFVNGFEQNPVCFMQLHVLQDVLETQKVMIWNLGQILRSRCSVGHSEGFLKQLSLSIIQIQYNYDRAVTLMLLPYFFLLHI